MTPAPLLTLSIVSHGDAEKIHRLLASLREHESDSARFQVVLTDNLRNDLPDFDSSPWSSLQILRNERPLGFAENHNRAFELAEGKYFAILNPDLLFEKPVFDHLINSLHANQADLVAPKIVDENGFVQDSFRDMPTPFELIRRRLPGYSFESPSSDENGLVHPDWIAGMFWLMPADVYRKLGGMDRKFRLYFEDVDFCARARLRGMKILVDAKVQVRHDAQRSSRRSLHFLLLHTQSAFRFFTSSVYRQAKNKR